MDAKGKFGGNSIAAFSLPNSVLAEAAGGFAKLSL